MKDLSKNNDPRVVPNTGMNNLRKRVFSGIQPTGNIHIGNYLGAIMSKSEKDPGHAVNLFDRPEAIRSKIMKATTDSMREIRFDENRPGINNLLVMYELFTGEKREDIEAHFSGKGYIALKQDLSDAIIEHLTPIQSKYRALMEDPGDIEQMLIEGAEKVRPIADSVLKTVKKKVGLG